MYRATQLIHIQFATMSLFMTMMFIAQSSSSSNYIYQGLSYTEDTSMTFEEDV